MIFYYMDEGQGCRDLAFIPKGMKRDLSPTPYG